MSAIPNRAYVVVSLPHPSGAGNNTTWGEPIARSIHLTPVAAEFEVRRLRKEVFERLAEPGEDPEEYVARLLTYRRSIKIAVCRLEKIVTALVG
jgi:hypothetical protein